MQREGNLNCFYQLRLDRLERARDRFRRGAIHENEFRELLAAEGMLSRASQDAEICNAQPGLRPIGEAAARLLERIRP